MEIPDKKITFDYGSITPERKMKIQNAVIIAKRSWNYVILSQVCDVPIGTLLDIVNAKKLPEAEWLKVEKGLMHLCSD